MVKNSRVLARHLLKEGFRLVSGGTDNHMMLIDFGEKGPTGKEVQDSLNNSGIIVNRNTVPRETRKPFVTSGIRLGTPAVTTRGMKEKEMKSIGEMLGRVIKNLGNHKIETEIETRVLDLTVKFPTP